MRKSTVAEVTTNYPKVFVQLPLQLKAHLNCKVSSHLFSPKSSGTILSQTKFGTCLGESHGGKVCNVFSHKQTNKQTNMHIRIRIHIHVHIHLHVRVQLHIRISIHTPRMWWFTFLRCDMWLWSCLMLTAVKSAHRCVLAATLHGPLVDLVVLVIFRVSRGPPTSRGAAEGAP